MDSRLHQWTDEQVDSILAAVVPGGSQARDWFLPHDTDKGLANVRQVVRLMLQRADELRQGSNGDRPGEAERAHTLADAHLRALLRYSEGIYGAAIQHGMKAGEAANAVAHIERAAKALHQLVLGGRVVDAGASFDHALLLQLMELYVEQGAPMSLLTDFLRSAKSELGGLSAMQVITGAKPSGTGIDERRVQAIREMSSVDRCQLVKELALEDLSHALERPSADSPSASPSEDARKLAEAIARVAQELGIYNGEVGLTGPMLLQLLEDIKGAAMAASSSSACASAAQLWDWFVEQLNIEQPLPQGKHMNLIGSIAGHKAIFLRAVERAGAQLRTRPEQEFEAWWNEVEVFATRGERLLEQFEADPTGLARATWLQARAFGPVPSNQRELAK